MSTNLRGVMLRGFCSAEDVSAARALGANLFRYPIVTNGDNPILLNVMGWRNFVMSNITHIAQIVLPALNGAKLVIDMHNPPGGSIGRKARLFTEGKWVDELCYLWNIVVANFKHDSRIYGYDILNEPAGTVSEVSGLMNTVAADIRRIDPDAMIIVSPPYGLPRNFSSSIRILGPGRVTYTAHMYQPMALTHAGVYEQYPLPAPKYPGKTTKEDLRTSLSKVRDFQKKHGSSIYIGEFSCGVPAGLGNRTNYIKDCISIFEGYGWNWSYHAWREADVWNAEPYPRVLNVLKKAWGKNG